MMRKSKSYKLNRLLSILLIMIVVAGAFPGSIFADEVPSSDVHIPVEQIFTVKNAKLTDDQMCVWYKLEPVDNGCPMPTDTTDNCHDFELSGNQKKTLGPITFTEDGIYEYYITMVPKSGENYTYDTCSYKITVHSQVMPNNAVRTVLLIHNQEEYKTEQVTYAHSYSMPVPPEPTPRSSPLAQAIESVQEVFDNLIVGTITIAEKLGIKGESGSGGKDSKDSVVGDNDGDGKTDGDAPSKLGDDFWSILIYIAAISLVIGFMSMIMSGRRRREHDSS